MDIDKVKGHLGIYCWLTFWGQKEEELEAHAIALLYYPDYKCLGASTYHGHQ